MKVTSWNIEGRLSRFAESGRRGSPEQILAEIERLDSDVLFLPEAFDGARPIEPAIESRLAEMGYHYKGVAYGDRGDRVYSATIDPHMLFMTRLEMVRFEELTLVGGIRTMLAVDVIDPADGKQVRFFGIHFDDRSEALRLCQVHDIAPIIKGADSLPVIALGDFNAMNGSSFSAKVFGSKLFRGFGRMTPGERTRDMLRRVSEMATGETLRQFEQGTGLVVADNRVRSTATPKMRGQEWMPSIPMGQIDHVYVSPGMAIDYVKVASDSGSDHRSISVSTRQM